MYKPTIVQTCMNSLLGWRNSSDSTVTQITDSTLLDTNSGLFFNDFHPLITSGNIENSILETDNLETYLRLKVNQGISKVLAKLSIRKKEMASTKTLLNSSAMFDQAGRMNNTIVSESRFTGFEITLKESYGVEVIIDKLGLQFTAPQTALNIYVYHTSQNSPIQTISATTSSTNSFEWLTLSVPINLKYLSDSYDTGGHFYLGYYENDVTGQAIKKDFDWNIGACGGCSGNKIVKIWNTRLNFLRVRPMYVANSNLNGTNIFDYQDSTYTNDNNYGMNFKTTIVCDLSLYFCEQKLLFADAIGKQVAVDVLNDIKHSSRANRVTEVNRNMIIRDLEGDKATNELGLNIALEKSINSLDFDFSKIDSPCVPCSNPSGVRTRSI